jgi:hypothetical protein
VKEAPAALRLGLERKGGGRRSGRWHGARMKRARRRTHPHAHCGDGEGRGRRRKWGGRAGKGCLRAFLVGSGVWGE